jgi:Glucanosyltransferase
MHSFSKLLFGLLVPTLVLGGGSSSSGSSSPLNPLIIKGNAFFDSVTGDRFYIRGVDYQVYLPGTCLVSIVDFVAWWIVCCGL